MKAKVKNESKRNSILPNAGAVVVVAPNNPVDPKPPGVCPRVPMPATGGAVAAAGCWDLVRADAMATAAALESPENGLGPKCSAGPLGFTAFFSRSKMFLVS